MKQAKSFESPFYCSAPSTSLFVGPKGDISACCSGTFKYGSISDNSTLEYVMNSARVKDLRTNVKEGYLDSFCTGCHRDERMSGTSQREWFKDLTVNNPDDFKLKAIDLRWSTVCNFACVYCNEDWSSTWSKLKGIPFSKSDNLLRVNKILEYIKRYGSDSIEQAIIAGGEPLVQVQNNTLLDILPHDCKIDMITNFSVDLSKSSIFEKLKKRSNVTWTASLENTNQQFEYIRQGGTWDIVKRNFDIVKNETNHRYSFLSVFNIFSAASIDDFLDYAEEIQVPVLWQTIKSLAEVLDPANFSEKVREFIVEKLENRKNNLNIVTNKDFIQESIAHIQKGDPSYKADKNFRDFIKNHEAKYNQTNYKFNDLWPELDSLISKDTVI